jgi:Rrf2 family protein
MKITYKGDYALKAILDLAVHYGGVERIEEIARRQDIPLKFLEQILLTLKKGGFVKSQRGRNGGYYLARDPKNITMGQVIRYMEGPIEPITCILKKGGTHCNFAAECIFRDIFLDVSNYISGKVDSVSFADLKKQQLKKLAQEKKYLNYSI